RPPMAARPAPVARPAPPPSSGSPVLYVVLGAMGVLLVAAGGFIWWNQQQANQKKIAEATQVTAPPPVTAAPPSTIVNTPTTLPPSAAPPPTYETRGKFMKSAQTAFRHGEYDEAIAQARKALAEDPGDGNAKELIQNAINGQKAELKFRAAESALRANDFEGATRAANEGRELAPWDERAP